MRHAQNAAELEAAIAAQAERVREMKAAKTASKEEIKAEVRCRGRHPVETH